MKGSRMLDPEGWRRSTPQELKMYRKALEKKLGIKLPPRGRPPKRSSEKYRAISIRLHPLVLAWAKREARRRHTKYQSIINETLLKFAA